MPPDVQGFGRSLLHAAQAMLVSGFGAACLLNSDSPTLPTALLIRAARVLLAPGERVVLGPADDGGYYLIGMNRQAHTSHGWRTFFFFCLYLVAYADARAAIFMPIR